MLRLITSASGRHRVDQEKADAKMASDQRAVERRRSRRDAGMVFSDLRSGSVQSSLDQCNI